MNPQTSGHYSGRVKYEKRPTPRRLGKEEDGIMEFATARERIIESWEDIIARMTEPAKSRVNGRTSYVCPLCGHGKGGDGLTVNPQSKDGKGLKCFGCGFSGDIIDLVGAVHGITEYPEKLKRAGEYIGLEVAENKPKSERYTDMNIHTETVTRKKEQYLEQCKARLANTDYLAKRGLSEEVATRFNLGYDPNFTKSTGGKSWSAIIIPTGAQSYVARNTDPQADEKNRYRKVGTSTPLNINALQTATKPVFVAEGELDALSIIEAGGEAVGLGSVDNINKFISEYLKNQKPAQPLLLALDNDDPGRQGTEKLAKALDELEIPYYIVDPYNGQKDANSALQEDREAFTQAIQQAEQIPKGDFIKERDAYLQTSAGRHIQEFVNGIADSADTPPQPTGFTKLDISLDGGLYEGLYIIGAITSLGKTTLALQIADQVAQKGRDVLIFSLEMARTELMSKSISRETLLEVLETGQDIKYAKTSRGITTGERYKDYSREQMDIIFKSIRTYGKYAEHIYISEGVGDIGVNEIRETIKKHIHFTGKAPVVLVDYMQILAPHDPRATDKQNTDKAVLELKRISRDYKIPVIGISSFNRASYKEEVTLEAFKESGAIEYGSDVLIGLQLKGAGATGFNATEAKKKDPREIELVILKNRNGRTGDKIPYSYYPLFNYFKED